VEYNASFGWMEAPLYDSYPLSNSFLMLCKRREEKKTKEKKRKDKVSESRKYAEYKDSGVEIEKNEAPFLLSPSPHTTSTLLQFLLVDLY